jgi:GAF domain-containing protein
MSARHARDRVRADVGDIIDPVAAREGLYVLDDVREISKRLLLAGLRQQELAEAAEQARERLAFLLRASSVLDDSRTVDDGVADVARLVVPLLADTCVVDLAVDGTQPSRHVVGGQPDLPDVSATVLQTGVSQLVSDLADLPLEVVVPDARTREQLCAAGIRSYIVAPLRAGERRLGALTLLAAKPRPSYSAEDLVLVDDLAWRCALAIDRARLQQEVQRRARLEGVLLAARTIAHELNNGLAVTVGYVELVAADPGLPGPLSELANCARDGAHEAARAVERLQHVARLAEMDPGLGLGTILDMELSTA